MYLMNVNLIAIFKFSTQCTLLRNKLLTYLLTYACYTYKCMTQIFKVAGSVQATPGSGEAGREARDSTAKPPNEDELFTRVTPIKRNDQLSGLYPTFRRWILNKHATCISVISETYFRAVCRLPTAARCGAVRRGAARSAGGAAGMCVRHTRGCLCACQLTLGTSVFFNIMASHIHPDTRVFH